MPEKLTRFQIEQFTNLLHKRFSVVRSDLHAELSSIENDSSEKLARAVYYAASDSLAHLLRGLKAIDLNRYLSEVNDIDAALMRIAKNEFGICLDCSRQIYFKRLLNFPTAKRCVACQRLYEKMKNEQ